MSQINNLKIKKKYDIKWIKPWMSHALRAYHNIPKTNNQEIANMTTPYNVYNHLMH